MKTQTIASLLSLVFVAALAAGCNSDREVEAKGEVQAPAGSTASAVQIEFYDLVTAKDDQGAETTSAKLITTKKIDKPGSYSEKLTVTGDKVRIFALIDGDGDGKCTAGEAWASVESSINDDDTVTPPVLSLAAQPCPK